MIVDKTYNIEKSKKLFSKAYVDPADEAKRLTFDFNLCEIYDVDVRLKDQFQHGFLVFLHRSEPVYKQSEAEDADEDDVEIVYTGPDRFSKPKIDKRVIGVIHMNLRKYLNPV